MERFGLFGTSIHNGGTADLGYYTVPADRIEETLPRLRDWCGFAEMVYLGTCNRVEVVFTSRGGRSPKEQLSRFFEFFERENRARGGGETSHVPRPSFYFRQGEQAVWHLAEVAASLDSLVLGESQIIAQVKAAYEQCFALGLARADLSRLFNWTLHTAKEVRTRTGIAEGRVSMAGLMQERISAHLAGAAAPVVGIVGSGPMGEKVAQAVRDLPGLRFLWVNRTVARAEALAATWGGRAVPLADFLAAPDLCDVLVTATSAPTVLFDAARLVAVRRPGRRLLVADLAAPRDTAPDAATADGVTVITIDDLRRQTEQNRQTRLEERRKALPIISAHIKELRNELVERSVLPVLLEYRENFLDQNRQEMDTLFEGPLRNLSPEDRRQVEKRINQIVRRNAHMLIAGLKEMASGCKAEQGALCCLGGMQALGETFAADAGGASGHPGGHPGGLPSGQPALAAAGHPPRETRGRDGRVS